MGPCSSQFKGFSMEVGSGGRVEDPSLVLVFICWPDKLSQTC